jgi:hypothetical protein
MTELEATEMATQLLGSYKDRGFDISMPDQESYDLMRRTFARLGRDSGPDGEFFVIKVSPEGRSAPGEVLEDRPPLYIAD